MLYIFLGPNDYDKNLSLSQLKKRNVGKKVVNLEVSEGLGGWEKYLDQLSLFDDQYLIVGNDQIDSLNKDGWLDLIDLWERVDVLESDVPVILLGKSMSLPTNKKVRAFLQQGKIEKFPEKRESEVVGWVRKAAGHLGIKISGSDCLRLSEALGYNQSALATQLYAWRDGGVRVVGEVEMTAVVPLRAEMMAFGLTDAWGRRDLSVALEQLEQLWQRNVSAQQIVGLVAWQIEALRMALLLEEGKVMGRGDVSLNSFEMSKLNKHARVAKKWDLGDVDWAMNELAELDYKIKTSQVEPRTGLEMFLVKSLRLGS